MLSINAVNLLKKLPIPFVYAASGWLITEIPVIVNLIPATFDGYTTTSVVAGLMFIGSAAVWVHAELAPYITVPSTSGGNTSSGSCGANDSISYSYGGTTVTVTPNAPIGTSQTVGTATFVVGQPTTAAFTSPAGTAIPVGAIYIGAGEFELNGNYYE